MKKILAAAVILMSLMACNNTGNGVETTSDTSATTIGDSSGINGGTGGSSTLDTMPVNTGDSTGINRDTSRADRTRIHPGKDTGSRRRSDSVR